MEMRLFGEGDWKMRHDFSKWNKRKAAAVFGVCLLCMAGLYFFWKGDGTKNALGAPVRPIVETQRIARADMMRRISLFGETVSEAHIDVAPKYAGRITEVRVDLGDSVKVGDILLVQDTGDLDLSIRQNIAAARQAEADVTEAEAIYKATYHKVKANFDRLKRNDERYAELYAQGAVSKEAYDEVHQTMIDSRAALDTLLNQAMGEELPATVESKRAALEKIRRGTAALEKQRDDLVLRAPRDGVISYRAAEVGNIAQAGQKVLELVDNSKFYVDCQLSEQDVAALRTGLAVTVNIESLGDSYGGQIIYVSPATGSSSRNYAVRVQLFKVDERVKAGMFARTQIEILQRAQTLFVPKESVVEKNGKTSVFVIDSEAKAQERAVKTGLRNDAQVEILSGLEDGDVVATSNLARLKTGMDVDLGGGEAP